MIKTFAAGTFLLMLGTATSGAMDLKDLIPCRRALRYAYATRRRA
jgi:hypothetical protein